MCYFWNMGKYTQPITRAEFCALAAAAYEKMKGEVAERVEFTDTDDINVEKMAALGIVSGVGDGRFLPHIKRGRKFFNWFDFHKDCRYIPHFRRPVR